MRLGSTFANGNGFSMFSRTGCVNNVYIPNYTSCDHGRLGRLASFMGHPRMNTGNLMCVGCGTSNAIGDDVSGFCSPRRLTRVGAIVNTGSNSLILVLDNSGTGGAHVRLYSLHLRVNSHLNLHSGGIFGYL